MFGIDKLLGGALDAIGLGNLAPYISLAFNVATQNWIGVAQDIAGLASNIDFLNLDKMLSFPPLGSFGDIVGGFANFNLSSALSPSGLSDIISKVDTARQMLGEFGVSNAKIDAMIGTLRGFSEDSAIIASTRTNLQYNNVLG